MTYESTLACARIIQRCEHTHTDVLDPRTEVLWPNGSSVHLHPVRQHGADAQTLRAFHHGGAWCVFDLSRIAPSLVPELLAAPLRDHPGLVAYGLRQRFANAEALRVVAGGRCLTSFQGPAREATSRPSIKHSKTAHVVGRADRHFIAEGSHAAP